MEYTKHRDRRKNNPTMENRKFFVKEEEKPYDVLYPRDTTLDPQLVWQGKDSQDQEDLAVPTVPIYVQEKIHPAQIIGDLKGRTTDSLRGCSPTVEGRGEQASLFDDFNGLEAYDALDKLQKSTEFYQHDQHWTNRMILGDSLVVMNSLAEKEELRGKTQSVFLDPPYGIKFGSNWQVSTRKRNVVDGRIEDIAREPEVIRAFRDTWKLGIHSYLAYLRDRLVLARELLTESGNVFVQIGDENVHLVRCVMDEVFGPENFVSLISFRVKSSLSVDALGRVCDYIVWYAKDRDKMKYRQLYAPKSAEDQAEFTMVEVPSGERMTATEAIKRYGAIPLNSHFLTAQNLASSGYTESCTFTFQMNGRSFPPPGGKSWKTHQRGMEKLKVAGRLVPLKSSLRYAYYIKDFPVQELSNFWTDTFAESEKSYVVQTSQKVIERCILMTSDPGDLVIDPTCGGGTTAAVAEQWGRRWITIDTSRVALALARTRIMAARFPYYLLADSPEGIKKEAELTGKVPPKYLTSHDVRKGFVYERVPHVTLKSIANNPDIREGMTREEIDVAIARHSATETLFDRPFRNDAKARVSGPFTVESLSPHRVLPAGDEEQINVHEVGDSPMEFGRTGDFAHMVIENLRKAGVQNTKKGERLELKDLQPYAGRWIQAKATFSTAEGVIRRVAVSIGPEYGAVGPMQVTEAAKEAMQGLGHDVLVVCGYAFDPHVSEEARRIGELTILPARMNADLAMGDELLKKTGAGNLFMVFGEPDLNVIRNDGEVTVELLGLDVYDPTTGEIRSNSTDDIACWFLDTDYNGESFFVRHAYFVGAEVTDKKDGSKYDPYRALRATLRAEIDEDAWASLYSTVSRPFPIPTTGKIAVKVINHYGDEVLRVYTVED